MSKISIPDDYAIMGPNPAAQRAIRRVMAEFPPDSLVTIQWVSQGAGYDEEWKWEIARFHGSAREISSLASRKIVLIDLGGKTAEEQEAFIELVREELKSVK